MVSELFDASAWEPVGEFAFTEITYHQSVETVSGHRTVRIAFNRPEVRNAFRPHTVDELYQALDHARQSPNVGCVLLTGNGPSPKDGGWAFCSGGDQRIRGRAGYQYAERDTLEPGSTAGGPGGAAASAGGEAGGKASGSGDAAGDAGLGAGSAAGGPEHLGATAEPSGAARARLSRLHILECQRMIRFMPKVVICVVAGWAAGGGHSLHVVCDLTLASREHARFKQTDADVASFDGGFGSAYLARQVGQKFAREIFFRGATYDAEEAYRMGMVNAVVPHAELERTALDWAAEINAKSPTAIRMLKYAFNAIDDGLVGQQLFAGEATRLAYMTDEAAEGRDAFLQKRKPDWSPYPFYF